MPSDRDRDTVSHEGVVAAIEHDIAIVAVAKGGCSACGKKAACGIGKLAAGAPTSLVRISTRPGAVLRAGDAVTVTVGQAALARAALLGYLFPATAIVVGAGLGHATYGTDLAAATAASAGLLIALLATRRLGGRAALAPLNVEEAD